MKVFGVGYTPPIKGLGATNTTPDRWILLFVAAVCLLLLLLLLLLLFPLRLKTDVQQRECSKVAGYLQNIGYSVSPTTRLGEAERKP